MDKVTSGYAIIEAATIPSDVVTTTTNKYKIEFEENMTYDVNDVEIFSAGNWNGDNYTEKDIDDMIAAHALIGKNVKPYLKLGHDTKQKLLQHDGMPSAGWVTNLKRNGKKLIADFKGIPKKIKDLIDSKAYGRFSSEIYWNVKIEDKKYRRVLKAVALLGADTPAVTTLDDFINLYIEEKEFEAVKEYHNRGTKMDEKFIDDLRNQVREYSDKIKTYENDKVVFTQTVNDLEGQVKKLTAEIESKENDQKAFKIKTYIDSKISEGKILPAQAEKFTALAEKDFDSVKEIVDSLEKQVDLTSLESQHVETEKSYTQMSTEEQDNYLDNKCKEYMEKHSVTYADAYKILYNTVGGK